MSKGKSSSTLSRADTHALACFFAMHYAALALKDGRSTGPRSIERTVMSLFGLVEKKGPFRLTPRGRSAVQLAKS